MLLSEKDTLFWGEMLEKMSRSSYRLEIAKQTTFYVGRNHNYNTNNVLKFVIDLAIEHNCWHEVAQVPEAYFMREIHLKNQKCWNCGQKFPDYQKLKMLFKFWRFDK